LFQLRFSETDFIRIFLCFATALLVQSSKNWQAYFYTTDPLLQSQLQEIVAQQKDYRLHSMQVPTFQQVRHLFCFASLCPHIVKAV
jgi:hypothetical protein